MAFTTREWTLDALAAEVLRDREYYRTSGGGVTLSGGEPLANPEFAAAFLGRLRAEGVSAALDTCGWASREVFDAALAGADLVLYDLKLMDDALHRRHTGRSNGPILGNAEAAAEAVRARRSGGRPLRLWIRTPLIPGATADAANVAAVGAFIRDRLAGAVERWELCAFNGACAAKYRKLGLAWRYEGTPLMVRDEVELLREAALGTGIEPARLAVTGLVARTKPLC